MSTAAPKRPRFHVSGSATIKHLNVRKEGPEDDKILAVDVKLEIEKVDRAICDYFDDALIAFLWRHETGGLIARNAFLNPIAYMHEISGADVKIESGHFVGCEVKKFAIRPRDGGTLDLQCSVSIYPGANDVADLAKRVQDGVRVEIQGPPDLFDGDAGAAAAAGQLDKTLREDGDSAILQSGDGKVLINFGVDPYDGGADPMLEQARSLVAEHQRASISLVQRHLRIGYNRAARLLEELERLGAVSAMGGNGARAVLVQRTTESPAS